MPCYHPLFACRDVSVNLKTGRNNVHILKDCNFQKLDILKSSNPGYDFFPVPCGNCIGCRLEYSRQWAVRCMLESSLWQNNYFLTLTYDNDNLPLSEYFNLYIDESTGELLDLQSTITSSLVPEHLAKFNKDLRAYYDYHYSHDNIRFFACGEYGDNTSRAHYHGIYFNLPIPDLQFVKTSSSGFNLYHSDIISKIWNRGFVVIGECNFSTAAYTARYVVKKHKGKEASFYSDKNIVAPFTRMSRMPGIGYDYYEANKSKIYKFDEVVVMGSDGPLSVKPPKYFDRCFEIDNPEALQTIKKARSEYAQNIEFKTDLSREDYLALQERTKLSQISSLLREL